MWDIFKIVASRRHGPDGLCICAIVKDELPYLLEWLAFHLLSGVTGFRIYDNESSDGTRAVLEALSKRYPLEVLGWKTAPNQSPQMGAYNAGLRALRHRYEFVAFIDADEFIFALPETGLLAALRKFQPGIGAIALNQRVFGSSGHKDYVPDLVTSRFTLRTPVHYPENQYVKSICRPERVKKILSPHVLDLATGLYVSSTGEPLAPSSRAGRGEIGKVYDGEIRLHHYILKSREEFETKRRRGGGMGHTLDLRLSRYGDDSFFTGREPHINAERDVSLAERRPEIIRLMTEMFEAARSSMPDDICRLYAAMFQRDVSASGIAKAHSLDSLQ